MELAIRLHFNHAGSRLNGLALLWLAFVCIPICLQGASVRVELDQETLPVGEVATLTLTLEGASPRGNRPSFPASAGLQIQPAGESTQITSDGTGRQIVQRTLTYAVRANQAGDFTIGSAQVMTDAGAFRTQPLRLRVTPASATPPENRPAFLRIEPRKTAVFVGESLPFELQLFVEDGRELQMPQVAGEGFNIGKLVNLQPVRRTVGGRLMNLVTFRGVATAVKSGPLTLGPATTQLQVAAVGGRQDFFGFFRQYQPMKLLAEGVAIEVSKMPPGAPADFTGSVGQFELSYTASPNSLAVGDPITLKISIAGEGNLEGISLPKLDHWTGFKSYAPNARTETTDALESTGSKHFEQVVVPQSLNVREVPEFRWTFFDPGAKTYRTLKAPAVPLQLSAATTPSVPLPAFSATNGAAGDVASILVHIRPQLGPILSTPPPLWHQPWFLGLQILPVGAWCLLRGARWRKETLEKNPRHARRREMERAVQTGLKQLESLAAENQGDPFFATLTKVLRCQIAERLDVPESGITESIIDDRLRPRGLPEADAAALEELFRLSNQFRYAPQSSTSELIGLIPKATRAVEALRQMKSPTP